MVKENNYTKEKRRYENQTSWRFYDKLKDFWNSNDYNRKIERRIEAGQPRLTFEDAVTILTMIWFNLKYLLKDKPKRLYHAAWILRSFIDIDPSTLPHHSIRMRVYEVYALKNCVSTEQARLDFLDGLWAIHRAARREYCESRETAVADLHDSLIVIKRLGKINFRCPKDEDIEFIDEFIMKLHILKSKRRSNYV